MSPFVFNAHHAKVDPSNGSDLFWRYCDSAMAQLAIPQARGQLGSVVNEYVARTRTSKSNGLMVAVDGAKLMIPVKLSV